MTETTAPAGDLQSQHLERVKCLDAISKLSEQEFEHRALIVSELHKVYTTVAFRFVSMLEEDAKRIAEIREKASRAEPNLYHSEAHDERAHSEAGSPQYRSARSASGGSSSKSPNRASGRFYLSAAKMDQTDRQLAPRSPALSARRRRAEGESITHATLNRRETSVSHVEMSNVEHNRRKMYNLRKMEQELAAQAKIVAEFAEKEKRRKEAYQRREAALLKKAIENEQRNASWATERMKLKIDRFDEEKPLRIQAEAKQEAIRVALKRQQLEQQARARASQFMDLEARQFVEEKKQIYEQRMAQLQEAAALAHLQQSASCSPSSLSSYLIERTIHQGLHKRTFHKEIQKVLDQKQRQEREEIGDYLIKTFLEPGGTEVRWHAENPATTIGASVTDAHVDNVALSLDNASLLGTKRKVKPIHDTTYTRLCGAKESVVLGIVGDDGAKKSPSAKSTPKYFDPSSSLSSIAYIRGDGPIRWK